VEQLGLCVVYYTRSFFKGFPEVTGKTSINENLFSNVVGDIKQGPASSSSSSSSGNAYLCHSIVIGNVLTLKYLCLCSTASVT